MLNLNLRNKFLLLSSVFALVLIVEIGMIFLLTNDSARLMEREIPLLTKSHQIKLAVVQVQQWLTDISATRGQDGLDDGYKEAENSAQLFRQNIKELQVLDADNKTSYTSMLATFENYYMTGKRMAEAYVKDGPSSGNKLMKGFDSTASAITQQVEDLLTQATNKTQAQLQVQALHQQEEKYLILGASVILGIIMLLIFMMMNKALGLLPIVGEVLARIAHGDIREDSLDSNRSDEIGQLIRDIQSMKASLQNAIGRVGSATATLNQSVTTIAAVTRETENNMSRQQGEVQQIATAMNEMAATSVEVARNASSASRSVESANEAAFTGKQVVTQTIKRITELADNVEEAAQVLSTLEQNSDDIGSILGVIRGIADQTNLLALNAAIEAARAGEQGRGFAVVADEVRTLASRTQQSTQEINSLIETLQGSSRSAVNVMERGQQQARDAVEQIREAGARLEVITSSVAEIMDMNTQIASASEEQSAVSEEINRNVNNVNDASHKTVESTRRMVQDISKLQHQADELQNVVNQFIV